MTNPSPTEGTVKYTSTHASITVLENEIDSVVYSLYNLIPEDIAVADNADL